MGKAIGDRRLRVRVAGRTVHRLEVESIERQLFEGGRIDVGEAVAQLLALALDPYPRSEDR